MALPLKQLAAFEECVRLRQSSYFMHVLSRITLKSGRQIQACTACLWMRARAVSPGLDHFSPPHGPFRMVSLG
jgi:hypothetical protein